MISINDFRPDDVERILTLSEKYSNGNYDRKMEGKAIVMAFFENSTRTRTSFEMAAQRLGAMVSHFDFSTSSLNKGENIQDTIATINAFNPFCIIVRSAQSGFCHLIQRYSQCAVINAGDGHNEHPSQALADLSLINLLLKRFHGLKITMCGDVTYSRVAHSNIKLLQMMGNHVKVVSPPTLSPRHLNGVEVYHDLKEGLQEADVIMLIRPQYERMKHRCSVSFSEYRYFCQLNKETIKYAKPGAIVMHPGPVNRGLEISDEIASMHRETLTRQAQQGLFVRQAILEYLLAKQRN